MFFYYLQPCDGFFTPFSLRTLQINYCASPEMWGGCEKTTTWAKLYHKPSKIVDLVDPLQSTFCSRVMTFGISTAANVV